MAQQDSRTWSRILTGILSVVLFVSCSSPTPKTNTAAPDSVSGTIENGLRILTLDPTREGQDLTIYRGDYVQLRSATGGPIRIRILDLDVDKTFPTQGEERPYFKVPDPGNFAFELDEGGGTIQAIEYTSVAYREVDAAEAIKFIANVDPLILDVRTDREFESGHIESARLIPVQTLQSRMDELKEHRNDPIFIYCASGNRSTVASKLLVDQGFTNVVNLRRGIAEWERTGQPVVR